MNNAVKPVEFTTYDDVIWDFPKALSIREVPDTQYFGRVFMILRKNEAVGLYIIDDGWAHFKASFHEMWLPELENLVKGLKS